MNSFISTLDFLKSKMRTFASTKIFSLDSITTLTALHTPLFSVGRNFRLMAPTHPLCWRRLSKQNFTLHFFNIGFVCHVSYRKGYSPRLSFKFKNIPSHEWPSPWRWGHANITSKIEWEHKELRHDRQRRRKNTPRCECAHTHTRTLKEGSMWKELL